MNVRHFAAAALVAALAVVAVGATGASGGSSRQHPDRLAAGRRAVRLARRRRVGQRAVQERRTRAGTSTSSTRPGAPICAKFDATLAGGNAPDVIEMGNTEMTKYMAAGAFQDLTASKSRSPTRAPGSRASRRRGDTAARSTAFRTTQGRGSITYRTDLFRQVGSRRCRRASRSSRRSPRSSAQRTRRKSFSPVYIAGTDWYFAMSFVYDYGGTDRDHEQGQVDRHARPAEGARRPGGVQELLRRRRRGPARRRTRSGRTRTTSTPRATQRRCRARPGSAAASATTRTGRRSS